MSHEPYKTDYILQKRPIIFKEPTNGRHPILYIRFIAHYTAEYIMSHMNESCHLWMSHVTYEW